MVSDSDKRSGELSLWLISPFRAGDLDTLLAEQSSLIAEHLHEVKRENQKQDQRYLGEQSDQCLRVFKTSTYELFKDLNPDRAEGTCQWVLCHPRFLHWHSNTCNDLLWISADPGCGKSVLTKSLVDNELRHTNTHTICYFFFKDNEEQDNLATALCALLHQLFTKQSQLIRHAASAWEKNGNMITREIPELWRILLTAGMDPEAKDVTCVLDALDECRPSDRKILIAMLSNFYAQTSAAEATKRSSSRFKILVTSRPYDDIEIDFLRGLENLPTIRLRGEDENDQISSEIDTVIRMRVDRLARDLLLDDQTKGKLETKLLEMEHHTYLWLHLATESVYDTYRHSLRPEHASISLLPSSVEDAYEKILNRVSEGQKDMVKKILLIIVGARRPLTIDEMAIALGIAISTEPKSLSKVQLDTMRLKARIRDWCGLFVFINHERIYLIHQTAKEFLVCTGESVLPLFGWSQCLHALEVEKEMAQICTEYLLLGEVVSLAPRPLHKLEEGHYRRVSDVCIRALDPFLVYAAQYWPSHLRDANLSEEQEVVASAKALYDTRSSVYALWFTIFWNSRPDKVPGRPPEFNEVHLAAILGHSQILRAMLKSEQCPGINNLDSTGRTALVWSCGRGDAEIVRILLEHGAVTNAQAFEVVESAYLPLSIAASYGYEDVVDTLLRWEEGPSTNGNINGKGFNAEQLDDALIAATFFGHQRVAMRLLASGADPNAQDMDGGRVLELASRYEHPKVIEILLEHGADVNGKGGIAGNALTASVRSNTEILKILIAHGADVNAPGTEFYCSALHAASIQPSVDVVNILLEHGANVNAKGGSYGSALQAAAAARSSRWDDAREVAKILLEHGADVNAQGGIRGTALDMAKRSGNSMLAELLIDWGAKSLDEL